ncbi:MAG: hypothetical protein U0821_10505 [Chloroflexota bacterium]
MRRSSTTEPFTILAERPSAPPNDLDRPDRIVSSIFRRAVFGTNENVVSYQELLLVTTRS